MSKSSTTTAPKIPLSTKSAWAKGPPQNTSSASASASVAASPRSQSPAATPAQNNNAVPQSHSRRQSAVVTLPAKTVNGWESRQKQGSSVSFGSIDDVSAAHPPKSSSANAPMPPTVASVKSEGVKSFGSVPAVVPAAAVVAVPHHVNGKPSISSSASTSRPTFTTPSTAKQPPAASPAATPSKVKPKPLMDIHKLFQNPGGASPPASSSISDSNAQQQQQAAAATSSPSVRSSNLPPSQQQPQQHPQQSPGPNGPSQFGAHPYTPFVPAGASSRPANQPNNNNSGSRSPAYNRQMSNGSNGSRPSSSAQNGLSSPRLSSHPHPQQVQPPPPQAPVPGWQGYYYPQMGEHYMPPYPPNGWYMPQGPPQHLPQQQHQSPHPLSPMPMSPRNPAPQLHPQQPQQQQQGGPPGTPTQSHAHALPPQHSHSHSHQTSISVSSPPPTPSSAAARLNTHASAFVPSGRSAVKVTIKSSDGTEVKLDSIKKQHPSPAGSIPSLPTSPSPSNNKAANRQSMPIRMESPEARKKRIEAEEAAEKEKKAAAEKVKKEEEDKKEKAKKELEEKDKKAKQDEEDAKKAKESAETKAKLEEEQARKEKERVEAEEKARLLKEQEEAAAAAAAASEAEAKRKAEEEEAERVKQAAEDEARVKAEADAKAEEQARLEEEAATKAKKAAAEPVEAEKPAAVDEEPEEGEIQAEQQDEVTDTLLTPVGVKPKEAANLHIKTLISASSSIAPPPSGTGASPAEAGRLGKARPGPLDLSYAKKNNVVAPLPSALATARIIDDLGRISYPEGVSSPKVELNVGAKDGKFRYDRDFLLQFMKVCTEKPDSLPPLDAIGLEPFEQPTGAHAMSRNSSSSGHSNRRGSQTGVPRPTPGGNYNSIGKAAPNPFNMGNFGAGAGKMSSEERFNAASAAGNRAASVGGPAGGALPFGRPNQLQRTASQSSVSTDNNRRRSQRGQKRNESNQVGSQYGSSYQNNTTAGPSGQLGGGSSFGGGEPIAPLKTTDSAWTAKKTQAVDADSPEMVDRKVKGLLNKLTMEKFDSISDQIITWANKSEKEKDGRTLIQVIRLVFEKATDEATWSEMYARLCRKMMETISVKVQDDGIKTDGKPIAGGQLFRKYLLNRCQEDFERGWITKEATAAAAVAKAAEDQAAKAAHDKAAETSDGKDDEEVELYSDEYYAAQKAKRQGLGLIKFIGELFKLQMLTERIMHECVKKLLGNVENPEEEEIESLCKLLMTVGALLDTPKARAHMDVYFSRMKELTKSPNVSSRMQFMLQDLLELRTNKWVGRNLISAPTTIAQIHEAAAKETAAKDKEAYNNRQASMSRGGSRRGGDRGNDYGSQVGPDGWAVAGGSSGPSRPPPKAGDLSNFGKIGKTAGAPMTFGPSSVFAGKKDSKRETLTRTSSSSNMFSMLSQNPEAAGTDAPPAAKSSRPPSRKTSVDFTQTGLPEPPLQRKRLVLAPRSKLPEEQSVTASEDTEPDVAAAEPETEMTDAEANTKIQEDLKEFFAVRNIDEAENYFVALPPSHHTKLIDKLTSTAIDQLKDGHATLVAELFVRAKEKSLCKPEAFEEAFIAIAEFLDDVVIDAPKAYEFMALIIKGAGLDEEARERIATKSSDHDKLLKLIS